MKRFLAGLCLLLSATVCQAWTMDVHSHEDRELLIPGVVRIDLLIGRRLGCDGVSSDFFAFDADEQLLAHGCYTKDDEVIKLKTDDGENISVPAERFLPISHPL